MISFFVSLGTQPHAKGAVFHTFPTDWWHSLDMPEVLHPQMLVAFNMNGDDIPLDYGAPVRLRVPRQPATPGMQTFELYFRASLEERSLELSGKSFQRS